MDKHDLVEFLLRDYFLKDADERFPVGKVVSVGKEIGAGRVRNIENNCRLYVELGNLGKPVKTFGEGVINFWLDPKNFSPLEERVGSLPFILIFRPELLWEKKEVFWRAKDYGPVYELRNFSLNNKGLIYYDTKDM